MEQKTKVGERLDSVMQMRRIANLSEFHRQLNEGLPEEDQVSYAATRKYVMGERDQPTAFLARVAEVFDVTFQWLAIGKGPKTNADAALIARIDGRRRAYNPAGRALELAGVDEQVVNFATRGPALKRLSKKLEYAQQGTNAPFAMSAEDHEAVLAFAARFLVAVEQGFETLAAEPFKGMSSEQTTAAYKRLLNDIQRWFPSWYAVWSDEVLALFTRLIEGMGDRATPYLIAGVPLEELPVSKVFPYFTGISEESRDESPSDAKA